jgi:hypothetical protein
VSVRLFCFPSDEFPPGYAASAAFLLAQKSNAVLLQQTKSASSFTRIAESADWRFSVKYCLVRMGVTIEDYLRDSRHRRHRHISNDEMQPLLERGFVEWLCEHRGVLRFVGQFCSFRMPLRGSSSKYGGHLARAIRRGEGWALVVREEMQRRQQGKRW